MQNSARQIRQEREVWYWDDWWTMVLAPQRWAIPWKRSIELMGRLQIPLTHSSARKIRSLTPTWVSKYISAPAYQESRARLKQEREQIEKASIQVEISAGWRISRRACIFVSVLHMPQAGHMFLRIIEDAGIVYNSFTLNLPILMSECRAVVLPLLACWYYIYIYDYIFIIIIIIFFFFLRAGV